MVGILDVFNEEQLANFRKRYDGAYVGPCPSCGNNDDGYGGCIINPDTNTMFCFGSKTIFNMAETVALLEGLISCMEGRQKL
jgi:hypothetical protein